MFDHWGNASSGDSTQLLYLRARQYSPGVGRFIEKDMWTGSMKHPVSLNRWIYTNANPVNFTDPSGYITEGESNNANRIVQYLKRYNVNIVVDWGRLHPYYYNNPIDSSKSGVRCDWSLGLWTLDELEVVERGVAIMAKGINLIGGNFNSLAGTVTIKRESGSRPATTPDGVIHYRVDNDGRDYQLYAIVHEMGHTIHYNNRQTLNYFMDELENECIDSVTGHILTYCNQGDSEGNDIYIPGIQYAGKNNQYLPSSYASNGNGEDFAETFRVVVSEIYLHSSNGAYTSDATIVYDYHNANHFIGRRRAVMRDILSGSWLINQRSR